MAACLALEVINNAFVDLNLITNESVGASASTNLKASSEALLQPCHRKRKHGTSTAAPKIHAISPIAVKIAALEALEALLTVKLPSHLISLCAAPSQRDRLLAALRRVLINKTRSKADLLPKTASLNQYG
nr:hypothetical protein CFP56_14985 [Quercus suber]